MSQTRNRPSVKNQKQINDLKAEPKAYRVTVEGVDCLYVTVTPAGVKKYVTSTAVSKRIQLPKGQFGQKSKTHGLTSQFTLPEIKRIHYQYYESFKRGEDPREDSARDFSSLERKSILNRPIVDLAIERLERGLKNDEIQDGYNDRLYTKKVQEVIGSTSFQQFTQKHADQLADAYPPKTQNSTAEKVKKLIIKTYNFLTSDAKFELQKTSHLLDNSFGKIKKVTRGDELINPEDIGEMWVRMLNADVNPIFKDAWVFMLLTGERRKATFKALVKNIKVEQGYPVQIFLDAKDDKHDKGVNIIPAFGVLALLINRLMEASNLKGSSYLFPAQKGKGALTSIKPLINSIGKVGHNEKRTNPHNLRRTIANLAIEVLGSQQIAEEQILHNKAHMTGSTSNYMTPASKASPKYVLKVTEKFIDILTISFCGLARSTV